MTNPSLAATSNSKKHAGESLSRSEQIARCAGCHQDAYQGWKSGPHAYTYKRLVAFVDSVLAEPSKHPKKVQRDATNIEACYPCHVPKNIFEQQFEAKHGLPERIWDDPRPPGIAVARLKDQGFSSGIDCLTCHGYRGQVLARAGFRPDIESTPGAGACDVIASPAFSSALGCVGCHQNDVGDLMSAGASPKSSTEVLQSCLSCHQAYNAQGKGTHYFYWSGGPHEESQSPALRALFDRIRISVTRDDKRDVLQVHLEIGDALPHRLGACSEWSIHLDVLDPQGTVLYAAVARVNDAASWVPKEPNLRAFVGTPLSPVRPVLHEEYEMPSDIPKASSLRIAVRRKAQFWLADDLTRAPEYTRVISWQAAKKRRERP